MLPSGASETEPWPGPAKNSLTESSCFGKRALCRALVPGSENIQEARSNLQAGRLEARCSRHLHARAFNIWQRDQYAQPLQPSLTRVLWVQGSVGDPPVRGQELRNCKALETLDLLPLQPLLTKPGHLTCTNLIVPKLAEDNIPKRAVTFYSMYITW